MILNLIMELQIIAAHSQINRSSSRALERQDPVKQWQEATRTLNRQNFLHITPLTYRNLSVLNAGQANEAFAQTQGTGYRVNDLHNRPFGLYQHLTRHTERFGRDTMVVTGSTFADDGPGASYNQSPGYHKVHRNRKDKIIIATDVGGFPEYASASMFDNWYVQYQIPRSDRQYAWITASLLSAKDHFGYLPADYLVSHSSGYTEPYEFVSASQFGAARLSGYFYWGYDLTLNPSGRGPWTQPYADAFLPTDFVGMNFIVNDPLTASTNVIGYPSGAPFLIRGSQ